MTELTVSQKLEGFLIKAEPKFTELNASVNPLNFKAEVDFARQCLVKNPYLMDVARGNPESLKDSITNVAAIGISLNPANKHAYLVPRTINKVATVCLDISYMGMIKLATDTGVVDYMKAEIVRENDDFIYKGFDSRPEIKIANPFSNESRGEIIGVIAWAKLHSGDYLCELMNIDELHQIRDDSEGYKSAIKKGGWLFDNCVWVKYYTEMIKKTVIKRLYKTLPQSDGSQRMSDAIHILNQHEGIDFNNAPANVEYTPEQSDMYKMCLQNGDYTGLLSLIETLSNEGQTQLWDLHEKPLIPERGKGRYTEQMKQHLDNARTKRDDNMNHIYQAIDMGDSMALNEILSECIVAERDWYTSKLNSEQIQFLNEAQADEAA